MTRMDVMDRLENDPAFKGLVDMLTAWLLQHADFTPTELREAAMLAAHRVDWMTMHKRRFAFTEEGTLIRIEPDAREGR